MRGRRTIGCPKRPSIPIKPDISAAKSRHGFDRNNHARLQARASRGRTVIRNKGVFVNVVSNAVPRKPANNPKPACRKKRLDRSAYVSDPISELCLFDANKKCFFGFLNEARQLGSNCPNPDRTGRVCHQRISDILRKFFRLIFRPRHSDINPHDIALPKNSIVSRDRVHHFVIYRRANSRRIRRRIFNNIPLEYRNTACALNRRFRQMVQIRSRNPRAHRVRKLAQNIRKTPPAFAKNIYFLTCLYANH